MNYIKQLNTFFELKLTNPLSSNAQCLYFNLLNINNKCNWNKEFTVANSTLMGFTELSRQALNRARNELVQKGYINYKTGKGNSAGKYLIVSFDTQNDTQSDTQNDTQSDTQCGQMVTTLNKLNKTKQNNISTTTTNKQTLFELIEQNFGRTLNSIEIEELSNWEDNELTRYVIKKVILSNIYSIRYISKVLYTYKQKGIRTVVDAEKEYEKFEKERNSKSNKRIYKSSSERTKEILDNWERKMEEQEKNDKQRNENVYG